jgi:uncharacterized protein (TIGR00369 family)
MTFDPYQFFSPETAPPAPLHLGWTLLDFDFDLGWFKVGFTPRAEFLNLSGHVQGGYISAMLDDTVGPSIIIKTQGKFMGPTIDLHTHFLSPLKLGPVTAEGWVTKLGKRIAFTEGKLFDTDGKLCARATSSTMLLELG